ncbi:MAG: YqgE/AlgH family protein [Alphaproteobacteria bacterium]|nr:YqgE/AlgH family protein [Alphaproteobacteria bacterium]
MTGHDERYLTGKLLLATPAMGDPRFERAVIYVCAHDSKGAMGLVINKALAEMRFEHLLGELGFEPDGPSLTPETRFMPVMSGGPVETGRGFLLHSPDFSRPETVRMSEALSLTGTVEALKEIAQGKGPRDIMFLLGYAGWGAGQLDTEIKQNSWLVAEAASALVFEKDLERKWSLGITGLGVDPAQLSLEQGRA